MRNPLMQQGSLGGLNSSLPALMAQLSPQHRQVMAGLGVSEPCFEAMLALLPCANHSIVDVDVARQQPVPQAAPGSAEERQRRAELANLHLSGLYAYEGHHAVPPCWI
jgi:hypothetical protein